MKNILPKISLVTPCYNVVNTIDDTLKSIHDQNYPNLEHIVVDGGSTDGTLEIIKKYESKISKIISKKDKGQYYAINEGFTYATGDIYCWLNADDISMPWTFKTVAKIFSEHANVSWLTGLTTFIDANGYLKKIYNHASAKPRQAIQNGWFRKGGYGYLLQESMFWRKDLWNKVNGLNCELKLAADFQLWIDFSQIEKLWTINIPLSAFRLHNLSRSLTAEEVYLSEVSDIVKDKKKLPILFRLFGHKKSINFLLRLFTKKTTPLIYQPFNATQWLVANKKRSISGLTFSELILEQDSTKKEW